MGSDPTPEEYLRYHAGRVKPAMREAALAQATALSAKCAANRASESAEYQTLLAQFESQK